MILVIGFHLKHMTERPEFPELHVSNSYVNIHTYLLAQDLDDEWLVEVV